MRQVEWRPSHYHSTPDWPAIQLCNHGCLPSTLLQKHASLVWAGTSSIVVYQAGHVHSMQGKEDFKVEKPHGVASSHYSKNGGLQNIDLCGVENITPPKHPSGRTTCRRQAFDPGAITLSPSPAHSRLHRLPTPPTSGPQAHTLTVLISGGS